MQKNNSEKSGIRKNSGTNSNKQIMVSIKTGLNRFLDFLKSIPLRIKNLKKPRVYKLRGYTTTSRVDKKVQSEMNQRMLRNILIGLIFILIIALLMIVFNPFRDLREIFRIIGI